MNTLRFLKYPAVKSAPGLATIAAVAVLLGAVVLVVYAGYGWHLVIGWSAMVVLVMLVLAIGDQWDRFARTKDYKP